MKKLRFLLNHKWELAKYLLPFIETIFWVTMFLVSLNYSVIITLSFFSGIFSYLTLDMLRLLTIKFIEKKITKNYGDNDMDKFLNELQKVINKPINPSKIKVSQRFFDELDDVGMINTLANNKQIFYAISYKNIPLEISNKTNTYEFIYK